MSKRKAEVERKGSSTSTSSIETKRSKREIFWMVRCSQDHKDELPLLFVSRRDAQLSVIIQILFDETLALHGALMTVDIDEKTVIDSPLMTPWKEELNRAWEMDTNEEVSPQYVLLDQLFDRTKLDKQIRADRIAFLQALSSDQIKQLYKLLCKPLRMYGSDPLTWVISPVIISDPFDV